MASALLDSEESALPHGSALMRHAGDVLEAARDLHEDALAGTALLNVTEAAAFASLIEDLSRITGQLQLAAAAALDGQRPAETLPAGGGQSGVPLRMSDDDDGAGSVAADRAAFEATHTGGAAFEADDRAASGTGSYRRRRPSVARFREFRDTADFMRARLRISRAEARRRLALAAAVIPASTSTGPSQPPSYPRLAAASGQAALSVPGLEVIVQALEQAAPRLQPEVLGSMEQQLTDIACRQDHDFLMRAARHWLALLDQENPPTEEELARFQGVFPGRRRNGLNHLHVYCTDEQHEALAAAMNAAANPRAAGSREPGNPRPTGSDALSGTGAASDSAGNDTAAGANGSPVHPGVYARLPRPTRPQQLLEGLLSAVRAALASGGAPAAGGMRPQVAVTISHESLVARLLDGNNPAGARAASPGMAAFAGPIPAQDVRKLACDADLIPVVLGSKGQVLDMGRSTRLFPPLLRKALHARDGGCTFPGCSVPGPWTEAHHVTPWESGGGTSIENGALLCSFHHHLIHRGSWHITMRSGVPWFTPPAYVDPDRQALRNTYFRFVPDLADRECQAANGRPSPDAFA